MEAGEKIKYFITSDNQFIINIDKISLINFYYHPSSGNLMKDNDKMTYTYNNTKYDLYTDANDIRGSYYNVYIDGVSSPVQLKYTDGIMLQNVLSVQENVFANAFNGEPVDIEKSINYNGINYNLTYYSLPTLRNDDYVNSYPNLTYFYKMTVKKQKENE